MERQRTEVRLTGAWSNELPLEYRDHPLIKDRPFFTLPKELLNSVQKEIRIDNFDGQLWSLEHALSGICGDHCASVGFWDSQLIPYSLLRRKRLEISDKVAAELGFTAEQVQAVRTTGAERLERFAFVSRAYAGWLVTNPEFRKEHDLLFSTWDDKIAEHGIPTPVPASRDIRQHPGETDASSPKGYEVQEADARTRDCLASFENFLIRWRLTNLAAPYLPVPLQPQLPVANLHAVLGHMRHGGEVFYLPDTFPVFSRDELRNILEDALRGGTVPQHLAEWTEIVAADNAAKTSMVRFARWFELQHYWGALFERHRQSLVGQKGRVEEAMAAFLDVSPDSIHRDIRDISTRLGPNWP